MEVHNLHSPASSAELEPPSAERSPGIQRTSFNLYREERVYTIVDPEIGPIILLASRYRRNQPRRLEPSPTAQCPPRAQWQPCGSRAAAPGGLVIAGMGHLSGIRE